MSFSLQNMPSTYFEKGAHNVSLDEFDEMSPEERKKVLSRSRKKEELRQSISELLSEFGDSLSPETFVGIATEFSEKTLADLYRYFAYMSVPAVKYLNYADLRNQASADFYKLLATSEFNSTELHPVEVNVRQVRDEAVEARLREKLDVVVAQIHNLKEKLAVTDHEIAQVFTTALVTIHRTIQQNYTRSMYEIAQILNQKHSTGEIQLQDTDLLKIVSAITAIQHHFPYV